MEQWNNVELSNLSKKSYTLNHEYDATGKFKSNDNDDEAANGSTTAAIAVASEKQTQKPGSNIKPNVNLENVESLVRRLYGITISEIKELISYDDRNYLIKPDSNIKNPIILSQWPHGYVLKILNTLDSKKTDFIDAQNQLMIYLSKHNIQCPRPVANVNGKYYSVEHLNGGDHVVRLLEYVPGEMFHAVEKSNYLLFQSGEYIAQVDRVLKGVKNCWALVREMVGLYTGHFSWDKHLHMIGLGANAFCASCGLEEECEETADHFISVCPAFCQTRNYKHAAYENHKTLWMLQSVLQLKDFVYVLKDHARKLMVEEIIEAFETQVLNKLNSFEAQIIHGDYNEQNIIVEPIASGEQHEYKVKGIIDFGDTNKSPIIFEVGIAMTYMMLQAKTLESGGIFLAGYTSILPICAKEKQYLKYCVAARLAQSLVMGVYTHSLDPSNEYVLVTQEEGWKLIEQLWREKFNSIDELWQNTADKYLTQSVK